MNIIKLKILDNRIDTPIKATSGSAGFDLQAAINEPLLLFPGESKLIPTGLAIHIDKRQYVAFILPRSKKGAKDGLVVGNLTGVIDSDYQGQWFISAWNRNHTKSIEIEPLDKIAQVVFLKLAEIDFNIVKDFTAITERKDGGIAKEVETGLGALKLTMKNFVCVKCHSKTFRKFYSTKTIQCDDCLELYQMNENNEILIKHQRG